MIENTVARNCQFEKRIALRDSSETFANLISTGTSCSKFEAGVIAEKAHEVFRHSVSRKAGGFPAHK